MIEIVTFGVSMGGSRVAQCLDHGEADLVEAADAALGDLHADGAP